MAKSDDSTAHTRRSFFREALSRLAQPVAEYVDAQIGEYIPTEKVLLRPPGAIPEDDFLNTCVRSGACINSCPAQAILAHPSTRPRSGWNPVYRSRLSTVCGLRNARMYERMSKRGAAKANGQRNSDWVSRCQL